MSHIYSSWWVNVRNKQKSHFFRAVVHVYLFFWTGFRDSKDRTRKLVLAWFENVKNWKNERLWRCSPWNWHLSTARHIMFFFTRNIQLDVYDQKVLKRLDKQRHSNPAWPEENTPPWRTRTLFDGLTFSCWSKKSQLWHNTAKNMTCVIW